VRRLSVSVTGAGQALAAKLPWPAAHGSLAETVRSEWASVDGLVLFVATGAAIRVIAPLLNGKAEDPGVVCVDDAGRWAVALCGGHAGGGNDLAREVAALLGASPVVTTATDALGLPALDRLPGFVCEGDVAGVTRALLDGEAVGLENPLGWPLPPFLADLHEGPAGVRISDGVSPPQRGLAVLHPPSLVVGVGASTGAPTDEVSVLVAAALAEAGLAPASVAAVATLDRKGTEPAVVALATALAVPLVTAPAARLAEVDVPTPSTVVAAAVGTPSVAEAAALTAAGPHATLVVAKQRSAHATVAVARRAGPAGHLWVVGLGPGGPEHRTAAATVAVRGAEVVIGYGPYVDQAADAITPGASVVRSPIGAEVERATSALVAAAAGHRVALVCSGDAGVYALASIVCELAPSYPAAAITVVPGVTAALAAAAALGAPLGHDHAAVSLSDLLTPWSAIAARLEAVGAADLVVSLYNPRSAGRGWQLPAALEILGRHRDPATPVGVVTDAGRPGERVTVTTLAAVDPTTVGMTSCVVVGASSTRVEGGRLVTPRGYRR